jgi:hypothetical protein
MEQRDQHGHPAPAKDPDQAQMGRSPLPPLLGEGCRDIGQRPGMYDIFVHKRSRTYDPPHLHKSRTPSRGSRSREMAGVVSEGLREITIAPALSGSGG